MDIADLPLLDVTELAPLLAKREVSPVEVTSAHLARIERLNPRLNAYITVTADAAMAMALKAEQEIMAGHYRGPWHGVPIALKDLFDSAGIRTTYGSKIFATHVPQRDATSLARLTQAGAILLGKLNLHEFATGGEPFNPHYGLARNPWKPHADYSSGGSSGGSGVATAAALAMATLGTDTGGSIRIPAALCGIVGLKPTYGRVSRAGVWPVSYSMDTVGPMTRSVADCALMLQIIAGYDAADPSSSRQAVPDYCAALDMNLRNLRAAVLKFPCEESLSPAVQIAVEHSYSAFKDLGITLFQVHMPILAHTAAIYNAIVSADAYAIHAEHLRTQRHAYGPMVWQRYAHGALVPAALYLKAQRARTLLCQRFAELLQQVDVIITPATLAPAATVIGMGEDLVTIAGRTMPTTLASSRLSHPFNLTGLPALVVPCGISQEDLPVALQLVGRPFEEATLLALGHAYGGYSGWETQRPPLETFMSNS